MDILKIILGIIAIFALLSFASDFPCNIGIHKYVPFNKGKQKRYYHCERCGKRILRWRVK